MLSDIAINLVTKIQTRFALCFHESDRKRIIAMSYGIFKLSRLPYIVFGLNNGQFRCEDLF